jgi:hypothetical protein
MNHLTPDELVDGADGALTGERRAHLEACDVCRRQLDGLRRVLGDMQASDVPEPSPLFWTHFSQRVRGAVADETPARTGWLPMWAGWRVLVPTAALALIVAALVTAVPRQAPTPVPYLSSLDVDAPAPSTDEPLDDVSWQLMSDLVVSDLADELALVEVPQTGFVVIPGSIERAASELDPAERAELLRLLRAELGRPES